MNAFDATLTTVSYDLFSCLAGVLHSLRVRPESIWQIKHLIQSEWGTYIKTPGTSEPQTCWLIYGRFLNSRGWFFWQYGEQWRTSLSIIHTALASNNSSAGESDSRDLNWPEIALDDNVSVGLSEALTTLTSVHPILSQQGGQTGHRLRGEVPHSVQHICCMNPVVIWEELNEMLIHTNRWQ